MKTRMWGSLCVVFVLLTSSAFASVVSGPITNPANNHVYYLLSLNTWVASQQEAVQLGGNLVAINNAAENQWVLDTFGETAKNIAGPGAGGDRIGLLIGINDADQEGTYEWVSGKPIIYTNWAPGQPQNAFDDEDYGAMYVTGFDPQGAAGMWHDVVSDLSQGDDTYGVVEKVIPVPAAVWMGGVLLGGLGVLRKARRER